VTSADARDRGGSWRRPVLAGAVANLAAGTLFAWSLVAQSVSDALRMSRGTAAAVFAAAIVVFAAVLLVLGPVQRRSGPRRLLRVAAAVGGGGLLLAATTQQPAVLLLGVAVLFGGANGLAYGVSVGLAARAPALLRGTATGLVVGAYAAGPVLLGLVAPQALAAFGWRPSLACLAVAVAGLLTIAAELAPGDVPAGLRLSRPRSIPRRDVVRAPRPRQWTGRCERSGCVHGVEPADQDSS
jgi:MFS family permease